MAASIRFLMCPPHHYEVDYVINPWMEGQPFIGLLFEKAKEQWQGLYQIISERAEVDLVKPQPGWPDMVFTANASLILGDQVVLQPLPASRAPGGGAVLSRNGLKHRAIPFTPSPLTYPSKGLGDALLDRRRTLALGRLWLPYRTGCPRLCR